MCQGCGATETLILHWYSIKGSNLFEEEFDSFVYKWHTLKQPYNSIPRYLPREMKICWYTNIHISFVYNIQT